MRGRLPDVRPLDRLSSIKIKLGVLVTATVTLAAFITWLGLYNHLGPRWTLPLAILVSVVAVQLLARGMTSPLREMTAAARAMAGGDYSQRVRATSRDEVGQLAEAFNTMAEDLEQVDLLRREMVANVSHELRTPVTALRGWWAQSVGAGLPREFFLFAAACALATGGLVSYGITGYHLVQDSLVPLAVAPLVFAGAMAAGAVAAVVTGWAYDRRGGAVLHVVAQQVEARAQAGEVVQPEDAVRQAGGGQDVGRLVRGVTQQAVDREAAARGVRSGGGGQRAGDRARFEDPDGLAVPDDAQGLGIVGRAHHRPRRGRVKMQMVPSELLQAARLALDGELQAPEVGAVVVVAERDVQSGQPAARCQQRRRQLHFGIRHAVESRGHPVFDRL